MILIKCSVCGEDNVLPKQPKEWKAFLEEAGWLRVGLLYFCPEDKDRGEVLFARHRRITK